MPDTTTTDAITLDHDAIHRAIGWPPPRRDEDGAIRAPTALELVRWRSCDPAILATMTLAALAEEIAHRAPAIAAVASGDRLATVRELRDRDRDRLHPEDAPDDSITDHEIDEWTRIGCQLITEPTTFRRVLATLASLSLVMVTP